MSTKMLIILCFCIFHLSSGLKPNVLFIIADDLRPALGCYLNQQGNSHENHDFAYTPNLDALAQDGGGVVLFENAYAQQAICGASRTSFLTGRRPESLHTFGNRQPYWRNRVGNFTTIPQYFREYGYHTVSVGKIFHPGPLSGHNDDWEYSWSQKPYHGTTEKYRNAKAMNVQHQPEHSLPDLQANEFADRFLRDYDKSEPFFLAVGYHKPHIPLKYPKEFNAFCPLNRMRLPPNPHRPPRLPQIAWNPWLDVKQRDDVKPLNITFPFGEMPMEFQLKIRQSYCASVAYIDSLIGRLIDTLKHQQLYNNTVIVFTSDHVDLFPTFADIAGLPVPPVCQAHPTTPELTCHEGNSLKPLLLTEDFHDKSNTWKSAVFAQYPRPSVLPQLNSDAPRYRDIKFMGYTIRTQRYHYTEWVPYDVYKAKANWHRVVARELYDLKLDPIEQHNCVHKRIYRKVVKTMRHKLRRGWRYA